MRNTRARNATAPAPERLVHVTIKLPTSMLRELKLLTRAGEEQNRSALIRRFVSEGIDRELASVA